MAFLSSVVFCFRTQGKLILDCFVDKMELGTANTIQDVIDRGIQIPSSGLLVNAGQLPMPTGKHESDGACARAATLTPRP